MDGCDASRRHDRFDINTRTYNILRSRFLWKIQIYVTLIVRRVHFSTAVSNFMLKHSMWLARYSDVQSVGYVDPLNIYTVLHIDYGENSNTRIVNFL
jgi:hypothetical protein